MRLLVTGAGTDGRSFLASVTEVAATGTVELYEAVDRPPAAPPASASVFYDRSPAVGALQWKVFTVPPDTTIAAHHTASVDLDHVVAGSVVLGLADGEHPLGPGDCVVVNGVGHSWSTGPEGVTMLITRIGTPVHGGTR